MRRSATPMVARARGGGLIYFWMRLYRALVVLGRFSCRWLPRDRAFRRVVRHGPAALSASAPSPRSSWLLARTVRVVAPRCHGPCVDINVDGFPWLPAAFLGSRSTTAALPCSQSATSRMYQPPRSSHRCSPPSTQFCRRFLSGTAHTSRTFSIF